MYKILFIELLIINIETNIISCNLMNKSLHRIYIILFFVVGIGVTLLLAVNGYQYYVHLIEERVFLAQHTALKPSGLWGMDLESLAH